MTMHVKLGERSYRIVLADSYAALPGHLAPLGLSRQGWVISHRRILQSYGTALLGALRRSGWTLRTITIPESETSKSLAMAQRMIRQLSRRATMRAPVLFAFGGGVVGDVTGFVAAMYLRGVPYIQLPTTLLAQVDSAIGGKVGVDLPQGKNLLGAFYQPRLVYNHLGVLATLPARQRRSGLAEIIKYGMIADPTLFAFLETHLDDCVTLRPSAVRLMVERSCRIKARIVSQDECETTGLRVHLNFGHTLGHAIEAASGYQGWTHGEAIAVGMCAAARLGVALGRCGKRTAARLESLIRAAGLPTRANGVPLNNVLRLMRYDKKFIRGRPRWVVPVAIGRVVVTEEIPAALVRRVITQPV